MTMADSQPDAVNDALAASVGSWTVDPSATTVESHTKAMWGLAKVNARFAVQSGTGVVGADGSVSGTLVIDAASIDTGNAKRDVHLRTKDFLEVEVYPTITYAVTGAVPATAGAFTLAGTLTVHGQSHPLAVTVTPTQVGPDRVTITAVAEVDRDQWGLTWSKMGAGLHNHIVITATFTKA
jgi:polyisoprenoid-binding protein YceI